MAGRRAAAAGPRDRRCARSTRSDRHQARRRTPPTRFANLATRKDGGMTGWDALVISGAGLVAGAVNAAVGSGSLLTFPTLLAIGYPPVLANVTNTVGLVPGSVSGAIGYRRELAGQRRRILQMLPASIVGGLAGAMLLLAVPGAFDAVVPILILVAVAMVLLQPRIARRRAARGVAKEHPGPLLQGGVLLCAVYGGYFGAA